MRKRISSLLIAGIMTLGLTAGSAFADTTGTNITIDGTGTSYSAYRLLDLTTSLKDPDCHADGNHTDGCWNYAYTVNGKYSELLNTVIPDSADTDGTPGLSDAETVGYIEKMASRM